MKEDENYDLIKKKLKQKNDIRINIRLLENQLKKLKNEKKEIEAFISNNCQHVWVKKSEFYQYYKSYNFCLKCKIIRDIS